MSGYKIGDRVRVMSHASPGTVRGIGMYVARVELDRGGVILPYKLNLKPCYCYEEIATVLHIAETSYADAKANAESIEAFMEVHAAAIRVREIAQEEMAKLHQ